MFKIIEYAPLRCFIIDQPPAMNRRVTHYDSRFNTVNHFTQPVITGISCRFNITVKHGVFSGNKPVFAG